MKGLLTEDFGQRKRPTLRLPVPGTASEDDDRTAGQNADFNLLASSNPVVTVDLAVD